MIKLNDFLEAGLWSTLDYYSENESNTLDGNGFIVDEINEDFKKDAEKFIDDFFNKAKHLFTENEIAASPIGHDLWLTVEGHGAGFWDGDYLNGEKITEIVDSMGFHDNYWSDKLKESINRDGA